MHSRALFGKDILQIAFPLIWKKQESEDMWHNHEADSTCLETARSNMKSSSSPVKMARDLSSYAYLRSVSSLQKKISSCDMRPFHLVRIHVSCRKKRIGRSFRSTEESNYAQTSCHHTTRCSTNTLTFIFVQRVNECDEPSCFCLVMERHCGDVRDKHWIKSCWEGRASPSAEELPVWKRRANSK